MTEEILLDKQSEKKLQEEERSLFEILEGKIAHLLTKFQELRQERDQMAVLLEVERDKILRLEKKLEVLTKDRDKVKGRIDQLLHRLKGIDV